MMGFLHDLLHFRQRNFAEVLEVFLRDPRLLELRIHSHSMERTNGTWTLGVFLCALCILSSGLWTPASAMKMKMKAVNFTYYLHDDFVPPNVTAVAVAGANATLTGPFQLGDIIVFDSVIRKTSYKFSFNILEVLLLLYQRTVHLT
ncbi:hypothetical protein AXG93_2772s1260 [Marchantia polymorpha subsp. ruderalis]|uniref:Dirigent protein n=1 Tax=Marchantia polymorpha subsp. ruderalis TaxID=1480154 RepID=A0A176WIL0_MARPO|nr:hypothetical protein AXG93_2772s1260 [Marchantia polymorpha subsp. ruderalis]